jgi:hypothetical protein
VNENMLRLGLYLFVVSATILTLWAFNRYVFCENETNHLGGSPYVLFVFFVPVVLVSFRMIGRQRARWLLPFVLGMAGILNVVGLDVFDVMKGYSSWIHAGMPERPAWSLFHRCD